MALTDHLEAASGAVVCRACGNSMAKRMHLAPENMFGSGERFRYAECPECGTLSLVDVPSDLATYYPDNYYSFMQAPPLDPAWRRWMKTVRTDLILYAPGPLARLVPTALQPGWKPWFRGVLAFRSCLIADIGCGSGSLLTFLRSEGFVNVVGVDPFLREEREQPVPLYRQLPERFVGRVDIAMMHHSLEHVLDPRAALESARRLLSPQGVVLVRVPLADSYAWRHYRTDWIALDPPRHITLFTEAGLDLLTAACGFDVVRSYRDSTGYQFWGSEQVRKGIHLHHPDSLWVNPAAHRFSAAELESFDGQASQLNQAGDGDAGCFLLRPHHR